MSRERGESADFEIRTGVSIKGQFLLTFRCDSCGNEGGLVANAIEVALYCVRCVDEDNIKRRLDLKPVRVEIRKD